MEPQISYGMITSLARLDGVTSGGDQYQNYSDHYLNTTRVSRPSIRYLLVESNWGTTGCPLSGIAITIRFMVPAGSTELRSGGVWLPGGNCNVEYLDGHVRGKFPMQSNSPRVRHGRSTAAGLGWLKLTLSRRRT